MDASDTGSLLEITDRKTLHTDRPISRGRRRISALARAADLSRAKLRAIGAAKYELSCDSSGLLPITRIKIQCPVYGQSSGS